MVRIEANENKTCEHIALNLMWLRLLCLDMQCELHNGNLNYGDPSIKRGIMVRRGGEEERRREGEEERRRGGEEERRRGGEEERRRGGEEEKGGEERRREERRKGGEEERRRGEEEEERRIGGMEERGKEERRWGKKKRRSGGVRREG